MSGATDQAAVLASLQRVSGMLSVFRQHQLPAPVNSGEAYQIGLCLALDAATSLESIAASLQIIAVALSGPITMSSSTNAATPPVTTTTITLP